MSEDGEKSNFCKHGTSQLKQFLGGPTGCPYPIVSCPKCRKSWTSVSGRWEASYGYVSKNQTYPGI